MTYKILVADDEPEICLLLSRFLIKKGFEVETAFKGSVALQILQKQPVHVMLCDYRLGDMEGPEVMRQALSLQPDLKVIIITGYSDIKLAVNVIKAGGFDYITKPLLPEEILLAIQNALDSASKKNDRADGSQVKSITSNPSDLNDHFTGKSTVAKELYQNVELVAPTNYSVIINGESGSGKESIALRIHELSPRKNHPFVAMDCGAISKELAGSELFGHEKGSFTGAVFQKIGHFEMANGGTIFLDEVVNLNYETQASLLRVVQERKLKRIGSTREIHLDVRILVATNENLADAVKRGKFREDLFHRFNEFAITVPSLRERQKDVMDFAHFFLAKTNAELGKSIKTFSSEVQESFLTYPWPGNLRELKNVIKRAALLTNSDMIETKSLPLEISKNDIYNFSGTTHSAEVLNGNTHQNGEAPLLKNAASGAEQEIILKVLRACKYNKTKAAKMLKVDRKTLYNKMKTLNIE